MKAAGRLHKARLASAVTSDKKEKSSLDLDVNPTMHPNPTERREEGTFIRTEIFEDFFSIILQSKEEGISDSDVDLIWGSELT